MLPKTYFPTHEENLMDNEGDLIKARDRFFNTKPSNLIFLLHKRYDWMNSYINGKDVIWELGCGGGFSKFYLKNPNLKLSDYTKNEWNDLAIDALHMPFENNSVDVLIASHMIHHLSKPVLFFEEVKRVLKPGGFLLISEIHTSFFMKFLLKKMKHEGWSYEIDIFNKELIANDPRDPWSANCAIPEILFADKNKFETIFPGLELIKKEYSEFLTFPLSGGVIATRKTVNLPKFILKLIDLIDNMLIITFPRIFALGLKVVIKKL